MQRQGGWAGDMLDNLKQVLLQHRKFLAIFIIVVFVPSIILAFFGIRAINNERYKLQQVNLEQQRGFVRALKAEVQSLIDKEISGLREFSNNRDLIERNYCAFSQTVSKRLDEDAILGQPIIWNNEDAVWFPGLSARSPAAEKPAVPSEWKRLQADIERAERSEFRLRNFYEAAALYTRILQRTNDNQVRAWILSRMARCEVKQKKYARALSIHGSLLADFPDMLTESGRPLEIASRMAILDILLAENNASDFFLESLQTFQSLDQRFWSLSSGQAQMYAAMLHGFINAAEKSFSLDSAPAGYQSSIADSKDSLDKKLRMWRMVEAFSQKLLPGIRVRIKDSPDGSPNVYKNSFEFEGEDVLVFLLPLDSSGSGFDFQFLVSLSEIENWSGSLDSYVAATSPPGISIMLRSNLSDRVLYGEKAAEESSPLSTDFFPENFPPWKVEVYQNVGADLGLPLYKNIFFWIILALLVIVFFGSGLIIRTIVQEVNLLNLKSEFIASVSHEFKTPLTAMGAILERLLDDNVKDPQKIREYYQLLSHDSEKLKRLVKNVLDFTKIEDGKQEFKLVETDINRLVSKEVDSFQKENRMAGFEVETNIENDIPAVLADEESLSQALHNILDNAVKFSGSERKINIEVRYNKERVEIAVQDWGIGMAEDEQKRVFEKFYRGKRASSVSPTGTGLGLTLVRYIMDGHGGSVTIRSQPGKGSRVSLILPLAKGG